MRAEEWLLQEYVKYLSFQLSNTAKNHNGQKKCFQCGLSDCRPLSNFCEKCGYPLI